MSRFPSQQGGNIQGPWARGWKSLFCGMGAIRSGLEELRGPQRHQCLHQEPLQPAPLHLEKPLSEWPVPQFISLFLPEFPMRPVRGQQKLQVGHWSPRKCVWEESRSSQSQVPSSPFFFFLFFFFQILGLVAKGSFGTVLKVLDCAQKAVFAVKVGVTQ